MTIAVNKNPTRYRLGKLPNGEIVLQGLIEWQGDMCGGADWETIETVDLSSLGFEKDGDNQ